MRRFPRELFKLLPISMLGVVLGHGLVYRWLFEGSGHQHATMDQQHHYLPVFLTVSCLLSVFSIVYYVRRGYAEALSHSQPLRMSLIGKVTCLFVVQSLLFVAMELLERRHGQGWKYIVEFINSPLLIYGLLFQLLTALVLVLVLSTAIFVGKMLAGLTECLASHWDDRLFAEHCRSSFGVQLYYGTRGPPLYLKSLQVNT